MKNYRLTQFSPGAGCGCKISSSVLETIKNNFSHKEFNNLIIGNETNDDAAVLDIGNGKALISTTDFFTPIVDNAFDFGRIAATNAISDVYAMGGKPVLSIAILGWPLEALPPELAKEVIEGATQICNEANIPLSGGHSINISVPIFGLSVNGIIDINNIKRNNSVSEGNVLFLTKPLGIGIISTAQKKSLLEDYHKNIAVKLMTTLNKVGEVYGKLNFVKAMTDVTGFGLLGHLFEMCKNTDLDIVLKFDNIPLIEDIDKYISLDCIPGGTLRNWQSLKDNIENITEYQKMILCDPQTSGGLLVAVDYEEVNQFKIYSEKNGQNIFEVGRLVKQETANKNRIIIE